MTRLLLCLLVAVWAWRVSGASVVDPTFRAGEPVVARGPDGPVFAMARFPDGRIAIAGDFARVNGTPRPAIAVLQENGSLDTTFNAGVSPDGPIRSVVALADGRLLVGGAFRHWGEQTVAGHLVRLNPAGALDPGFASVPDWEGEINQVIQGSNGNLWVLGHSLGAAGRQPRLQRRTADGVLDPTFKPTWPVDAELNGLAFDAAENVLLVGRFTSFNGEARTNLVRLSPDGAVDPAFSVPAAAEAGELSCVAVANDGRIAIGGVVTNVFPLPFLAVLKPEGIRDPEFSASGGPGFPVVRLAFNAGGDLLTINHYPSVSAYWSSGQFTRTGSQSPLSYGYGIAVHGAAPLPLPNGKTLWPINEFTTLSNDSWSWLLQSTPAGDPDTAFIPGNQPDVKLPWPVTTFALLPSGNVVAPGKVLINTNQNPGRILELVQFDSSGFSQPAFAPRLSRAYNLVSQLTTKADGKILVAGAFRELNGETNSPLLARLNQDGSRDPTFNLPLKLGISGGAVEAAFYQVEPLADGRIFATGPVPFKNSTGTPFWLGRFLGDGSLDASFSALNNSGFYPGNVSRFVSLGADRLLLWGRLPSFVRQDTGLITYDATGKTTAGPELVATGGFPPQVSQLVRLPDHRVLIAGSFSRIGGVARTNLAMVYPDLSVDLSFDVQAGPNDAVTAATPLFDGRILVGGAFTRWNGEPHRRLVLLHPDGRLDTSFDPGTGPDNRVLQLTEQPDGRVLIGGSFNSINGEGPSRLARLLIPPVSPALPARLVLQPKAAIFTNSTSPAVLEAGATGTPPLRWQWFREGIPLNDSEGFRGATSPRLIIDAVELRRPATYQVEVSNQSGRERSSTVIAGLASGTIDPEFTTNRVTGKIRLTADIGSSALLAGDVDASGRVRRVLIFGRYSSYDSAPAPGMVMVRPDGSRDLAWKPPAGVTGSNTAAAVFLPDGRVVLGGSFSRANGAARDIVMRLQANGTLDPTFDPGDELTVSPPFGLPKLALFGGLALDGEAGVLVTAPSTSLSPFGTIRRLDSNGHTDSGFIATDTALGGFPKVIAVRSAFESDILLSGDSFSYAPIKSLNLERRGVAHLFRSGALDTNYNAKPRRPDTSANGNITAIVPLSDGGSFVAGTFAEFDAAAGPLVRIDARGIADTNFAIRLAGTPGRPLGKKPLAGITPARDGTYVLNYASADNSTDSVLKMAADGTVVATSGGALASYGGSGLGSYRFVPLDDDSFLVPITVRQSNPLFTASSVGRFWLTDLSAAPRTNLPPVLFHPPRTINHALAPNVRAPLVLSVAVQSGGATRFQWSYRGVPLMGETNSTLVIADPTEASSGTYRLEVTNAAGSVTADIEAKVVSATASPIRLTFELVTGERPLRLRFTPSAGRRHRLERSADLLVWEPETDPGMELAPGELAPQLGDGFRFYRLVEIP